MLVNITLEGYKNKRNFDKTPEPLGGKVKNKKNNKLIYVIQKHYASNLHYDLRLEYKGVLMSWAVPKKPPLVSGIKRLAVKVEDHPIEYAEFQGIIPQGYYGAGKVEIWDKGYYYSIKNIQDEIIFDIFGRKLSGIYCLIKFKKSNNKKNWLLFKKKVK